MPKHYLTILTILHFCSCFIGLLDEYENNFEKKCPNIGHWDQCRAVVFILMLEALLLNLIEGKCAHIFFLLLLSVCTCFLFLALSMINELHSATTHGAVISSFVRFELALIGQKRILCDATQAQQSSGATALNRLNRGFSLRTIASWRFWQFKRGKYWSSPSCWLAGAMGGKKKHWPVRNACSSIPLAFPPLKKDCGGCARSCETTSVPLLRHSS